MLTPGPGALQLGRSRRETEQGRGEGKTVEKCVWQEDRPKQREKGL